MTNIQDAGRFIAEGYSFYTERDAALAESERRKVEYLEARLDYNNPDSILRVYQKAIHERLFRSPVGLSFLKKLQQYLMEQPGIDSEAVDAIPLYVSFEGEFREQANPARTRVNPAPEKKTPKKSAALPISIILNICLVIAMIAMFSIALNANQPNILNYEKVLTNNYASWEQELTEREQAVKEKERQLNME